MRPVTGNEPPDAIKANQGPTSAQTILDTVDRSLAVGQTTVLQVSTTGPDGSNTIVTIPVIKTDELPETSASTPPPEE